MPVSIITVHGEYDSVMLEAYSPTGYGNLTPYLYAECRRCPNTVFLAINMAPSGVLADAIEDEIEYMGGNRIMEIVEHLRTGANPWQTARAITSNRHRGLDLLSGYTPYPWTAIERMISRLETVHRIALGSE